MNIKKSEVQSIIDELINEAGVLGALGPPNSINSEVRRTYAAYNMRKMSWNTFGKELERLMWKSKTNEPDAFPALKQLFDGWQQRNQNPNTGIQLKNEGDKKIKHGTPICRFCKKDLQAVGQITCNHCGKAQPDVRSGE